MTRTAKTTTAKNPVKVAPKVQVEDTPRLNRYQRSAAIIVGNLTIDVATLSERAAMSESTSRHCLEAWSAITGVLKERGMLTPAFAKQLSAKPSDTTPATGK